MTKNNSPNYKYKFSFVMPVYNVDDYLSETIESVIAQTMDFESNVEIILINDGSTDNSERICLQYKEQFPSNIKYIKKENGGVSSARNCGLDVVEGKYISFLDSDDKLSKDTLSKVYRFFEVNQEKIDVVSIKMSFFGSRTGPHTLNYKFVEDKVVDMTKEFEYIQTAGGPTFVKTAAIGKARFDTNLKISEDIKLITEILIKKKHYGVLRDPIYFYRRRDGDDSATSGSYNKKHWYGETLENFHKYILNLSSLQHNHDIGKYLQYLAMYEMQWRFMQQENTILSGKELKKYKDTLFSILSCIDDEVIMLQRNMPLEYKVFALSKKHNKDIKSIEPNENGECFLSGVKIFDYKSCGPVVIDLMDIVDEKLVIEGNIQTMLFNGVKFGVIANGRFNEVMKTSRPYEHKKFLGELVFDRNTFRVVIPIKHGENISPTIRIPSGLQLNIPIEYSFHARMDHYSGYRYRAIDSFLICHIKPGLLVIVKNSPYRRLIKEIKLQASVLREAFAKRIRKKDLNPA